MQSSFIIFAPHNISEETQMNIKRITFIKVPTHENSTTEKGNEISYPTTKVACSTSNVPIKFQVASS